MRPNGAKAPLEPRVVLLILACAVAAAAAPPVPTPWDIVARSTTAQKAQDGTRLIEFVDDVVITHGELVATADRARYLEGPRRAILQGRVVMNQDTTIVRGPFAYYERDTGTARFPYGVLIERPTGTAVADNGIWQREDRTFELRGRASAADTAGTLDAEAITYDLREERLWAVGDARLVDDVTGVIVEGQNLRYDRRESLAMATGDPTAVFRDADTDIHVASERMTYDPRTKEAVAEGDVRIRRESMEATCGRAVFYRETDVALLGEDPELRDGGTVVKGEQIELLVPEPGRRIVKVSGGAEVSNRFLEDRARPEPPEAFEGVPPDRPEPGEAERVIEEARERVREAGEEVRRRVDLPEGALSEEPIVEGEPAKEAVEAALAAVGAEAEEEDALPDSVAAEGEVEPDPTPPWLQIPSAELPTENLLFGDEITMYFTDDAVERVVVVGHGRSKFFPNEQQGELTEWNDVRGDTLHVWFTASEIDSVHVLGSGSGEYRLPAGNDAGLADDELRARGKLVDYRAPRIRYLRDAETMHLDEGAEVHYKTMTLTSGKIDFEARREIMTAGGDPAPVLVDREDELRGDRMNYHLPSGKGEIVGGRTRFEAGYYRGEDIWKMDEDVLAVNHAEFTTCDLEEHPHYHFACRRMKIYLDDKMVAQPVVLKIRDIPVFALPFYMTSLRKDRHSGFLLPNLELGVDDDRGRFVRNLGYYWAPSDYADVTATVDFYPGRDQFVGYLNTRYNLRYRFQGRVGLKYNRDAVLDRKETAVEVQHEQNFSDTMRLTADARFLSSSSIYQDIDDSQRLNRDLRSHATFTKQFAGSRNLRVEVNRQENLDTGSLTETLPTVAFTQPSSPITGKKTRTAVGEEDEGSWLDEVYWKLDGRGANQRTKNTAGVEEKHIGSTLTGRLTSTQNVLGALRISPAVDGEATWIDEDRTGEHNALRATYNGSLTARTDLYGTLLRSIGPVRGFRHVVRPSVSWTWAPEFREYFYVEEGDTTGTLRDRFFSFGGIPGTQRKTNRMSASLGNLIQTKVARGESESRYDLFNFNTTISYDFLAEETGRKPLSNLNNSLNVLSASPINQTWSVAHDPYTWNLLSSSVTTRAALSSRLFGGEGREPAGGDAYGYGGDSFGEGYDDPVGGGRSPRPVGERFHAGEWQATVSHTARRGATSGSGSSNLVFNGSWSPTAKWRVSFDYNYDLKEGVNTAQSFSVLRTIHCWQLEFDRRLLGGDWQYYLRINVTDLPDLQLERGDRAGSRGFGTSRLPGL